MKHFAVFGHASQTTYYPGAKHDIGAELSISRIGDTQGNGKFSITFFTPYSWGLLALEGEAYLTAADKQYVLIEGTVCLFRAGREVHFRESREHPFRYLWFDVRGNRAETLIDRFVDSEKSLFVRSSVSGDLRRELQVLQEAFVQESYSEVTQVASAWKILDCLCRDRQSKMVDVAHSCRVLIETEFLRGITVEGVAKELGVSRSTLFRRFREAYGESPKAYMDELRIEHACSLLRSSRLTNKEVATQSGFDTLQNFYRMFKKHRGRRPSEMRG